MNDRSILLALLLAVPACVHAATICSLRQSGTLTFPPYDAITSSPNDSSLDVVVGCERDGGAANVSIQVAIGPSNVSGTSANRRMRLIGGNDQLSYNLYRDAGRTAVWGFTNGLDTRVQTLNVPNKGSATSTFTVYGRINSNQDVALGSYTDSVQITISP